MALLITNRLPEGTDSTRDVLHKQLAQTQDGAGPLGEIVADGKDITCVRSVMPYELSAAAGLIEGHLSTHKFGVNQSVPNGSFADIWPLGGQYPWPIVALPLRVRAGGSADDDIGGVGARIIQIIGLDQNFNTVTETIALNGALVSAQTTALFSRVNRIAVTTAGTYTGNNVADITVENSVGVALGFVGAGFGQTQMSMVSVGAGRTGFLTDVTVQVAIGSNKDADIRLWVRNQADQVVAPYGAKRLIDQLIAIQGVNRFPLLQPVAITGPADIWFEAQGNGSTTAVNVSYGASAIPTSQVFTTGITVI